MLIVTCSCLHRPCWELSTRCQLAARVIIAIFLQGPSLLRASWRIDSCTRLCTHSLCQCIHVSPYSGVRTSHTRDDLVEWLSNSSNVEPWDLTNTASYCRTYSQTPVTCTAPFKMHLADKQSNHFCVNATQIAVKPAMRCVGLPRYVHKPQIFPSSSHFPSNCSYHRFRGSKADESWDHFACRFAALSVTVYALSQRPRIANLARQVLSFH